MTVPFLGRAVALLFVVFVCVQAEAKSETPQALIKTSAEEILAEIRSRGFSTNEKIFGDLEKQPLIIWAKQAHYCFSDRYSSRREPNLVVQLEIANQTTKAVTFLPRDITLNVGTESLVWGRMPNGSARRQTIIYDSALEVVEFTYPTIAPPPVISVEPGEGVRVWAIFFGLPKFVESPNFTLQFKSQQDQSYVAHLTRQRNAALGLKVERIGPKRSLGVVKMTGEIDSVNAYELAQQLNDLADDGCKRCLIQVKDYGDWLSTEMVEWLGTMAGGADAEAGREETFYPQLPEFYRFAICSDDEFKNYQGTIYLTGQQKGFFFDMSAGVDELLSEIYENSSSAMLIEEISSGHPLTQNAALRFGGAVFTEQDFDFLKSISQTENRELRRNAFLALSFQTKGAAYLFELLSGKIPEVELDVLSALLQTSHEQRVRDINDLLVGSKLKAPIDQILKILEDNWHPVFLEYSKECLKSASPAARSSALKLLQSIGTPDLEQIAIEHIHDAEPSVRTIAFKIANESNSAAVLSELRDYVDARLSQNEIDRPLLVYLQRVSYPKANAILLKALENSEFPQSLKETMVDVIVRHGTKEEIERLVLKSEGLPHELLAGIINAVPNLSIVSQLKAVEQIVDRLQQTPLIEIDANQKSLLYSRLVHLVNDIDTQASRDFVDRIVVDFDLAQIAMDPTLPGVVLEILEERTIYKVRLQAIEEKDLEFVKIIDAFLIENLRQSNGWNYFVQGNFLVAESKIEEAIPFFSIAIKVNPDFSAAYSSRGNSYLRLEKFDLAGSDFRRAYELNQIDESAISGLSIVEARAGQIESALQRIQVHERMFPNNIYFPYNKACVYARCVEYLRTQPASPVIEAEIQKYSDVALSELKVSINRGFSQIEWMQIDPDLISIRTLPRFQELVKLGEKNAQEVD